ncbi:MAG: MaoC family dehydratase [Prevotella sp.]|nr:MaoC family dehydratase [Prevotella sp.]MDD6392801.1 MaoC family dehydratase [Prevotella sp.]MDY2702652.1 MaoC family dehydratase [Prevotella sp.]
MEKLIINSYDEFAAKLDMELGKSEWLEVDQERINMFADATLDHQWIHVDTEKAKVESPYKSTIAHGYLTLSLLPYMWEQIIEVRNIKMLVNYGMDKMRFGQPVITGSRVRLVTKLHNIQNLRGICKAEIDFKIEIEGQRKPALEGIASFLYYFNAN